jgi:hypothetical protein
MTIQAAPISFTRCAEIYPHHPAMLRMPMSSALETLRTSILDIGLQAPLLLFEDATGKEWHIDGRSRVKVVEELGIPVIGPDGKIDTSTVHRAANGREWSIRCEWYHASNGDDPDKIVSAYNVAHRQWRLEDRRNYATELLKGRSDLSNRVIAGMTGLSDHTVASIRATLASTAQITQFTQRVGADGKTRRMPTRQTNPHPAQPTSSLPPEVPAPWPPSSPPHQPTATPPVDDAVATGASVAATLTPSESTTPGAHPDYFAFSLIACIDAGISAPDEAVRFMSEVERHRKDPAIVRDWIGDFAAAVTRFE